MRIDEMQSLRVVDNNVITTYPLMRPFLQGFA